MKTIMCEFCVNFNKMKGWLARSDDELFIYFTYYYYTQTIFRAEKMIIYIKIKLFIINTIISTRRMHACYAGTILLLFAFNNI